MITLYCGNQSDQNIQIHLFVELANVEQNEDLTAYGTEHGAQEPYMVDSDSDPDVDEVFDDIDNEDMNDDGNINVSSVGNQIRRIVIHNNPGLLMPLIDPDAAQVAEFLEHLEILLAHWLAVNSNPKKLFVSQRFETISNQMEAGYVFIEDVRDAVVANHRMVRLMNVEICSRCLETFRVTKTIDRQPGIPPRSYGVDL
ncbi:hypothetical protein GOBAR_AA29700 [Gossypium barbadense]|uniref:Uncharacterized protein n=1 Tax=Gossypium barbadense TaxID=3634 RepID=A0A2P5WIT2_GOSBA|nr:hypothetical protein GOBAR_AA29700 [Gossypium barbadense]